MNENELTTERLTAIAQALAQLPGGMRTFTTAFHHGVSNLGPLISNVNAYPALFLVPRPSVPIVQHKLLLDVIPEQVLDDPYPAYDDFDSAENEPIRPVPAAPENLQGLGRVKREVHKIETKLTSQREAAAREQLIQYKQASGEVRASGQAKKQAPTSPKSVKDVHQDDAQKHDKPEGSEFRP